MLRIWRAVILWRSADRRQKKSGNHAGIQSIVWIAAAAMTDMVMSLAAEFQQDLDSRQTLDLVVRSTCAFYDGDWCGIQSLQNDLDAWTPLHWYNAATGGMTDTEHFYEYEVITQYPQRKKAIEDNHLHPQSGAGGSYVSDGAGTLPPAAGSISHCRTILPILPWIYRLSCDPESATIHELPCIHDACGDGMSFVQTFRDKESHQRECRYGRDGCDGGGDAEGKGRRDHRGIQAFSNDLMVFCPFLKIPLRKVLLATQRHVA